ncbi:VOC family protein [Mangrovibacterium sp.]|uniref:VOC family protein n=1 Tax=Mangrovibacterium sp. TaxID=1961364 RepID=UPI003563F0A2
MKITHLAIWTSDLEGMRNFYLHYFDASSKEAYYNHSKDYKSYFLIFNGDCMLELMQMPGIPQNRNDLKKQATGLIHFAISVGSKKKVDELTEKLRVDGFRVMSEPRITGDGFYESVVLDPEGNRIELTE